MWPYNAHSADVDGQTPRKSCSGSDVSVDFVSESSVNASKPGVEGCLGNPARLGVKEEKTVHPNRERRV